MILILPYWCAGRNFICGADSDQAALLWAKALTMNIDQEVEEKVYENERGEKGDFGPQFLKSGADRPQWRCRAPFVPPPPVACLCPCRRDHPTALRRGEPAMA